MLCNFPWNSTVEPRPSTSLGNVLFAVAGTYGVGGDIAINAIGMISEKSDHREPDLDQSTQSGRCRRVLSPT
jgi:hypothetical protein